MGPDSRIEKAGQCFTDKVQRITLDWSQEIVNLSQPKVSSTDDIKQSVREHCSKTLVIVKEDQVILRGPKHELSQAKRLVEDLINSAAPQRSVNIITHGMMGEIPVDGRHLDILKQLRFRDINEIEQKYGVKMEEKPIDKKNVQVKFRAADGPPDLGVHACHTFLTLLHTTLTNTIRSDIKVKPGFQDTHLGLLHERLKLKDTKIIVKNENNSVILIGSPNSVLSAKKTTGIVKQEGAPKVMGAEGGGEESVDTGKPASAKKKPEEKEDDCPICMDAPKNKIVLDKCKHGFCENCIKKAMDIKPVCPVCNVVYGRVKGNQPDGRMSHKTLTIKLPGYKCGTIQIEYAIPSGTQGANHPNPGKPFSGASRTAYLPDDTEGREILQLLRKAFDQKLIFTVGESRTSGSKDTVTWNDIHHKTTMFGGPSNFGYPDPDYLRRVRDELKAKGIE
ncbi:LOW QUALITY PROTEIN: E3 ubiquitin-protein ligase DTX3L-like [Rhinophrynus dorsalis]